jgi:ABC-type sulfate/molybdate transport systems ATPase subunit
MASELRVEAFVPQRLDAAFTVPAGITVLFGPSGAGKTTCLSVIAGLLAPRRGRVVLNGEDLTRVPAHRRGVALVFQSLALFPHLTALQNVAYGARNDPRRWLERMRVNHAADRKPGQLSGGEAQRVALARALASEPKVLLLDEPFSALDSELRAQLGDELKALVGELKIPTVLVTHDRADAAALGERVVVIEAGRVVSEAPMLPPTTRPS